MKKSALLYLILFAGLALGSQAYAAPTGASSAKKSTAKVTAKAKAKTKASVKKASAKTKAAQYKDIGAIAATAGAGAAVTGTTSSTAHTGRAHYSCQDNKSFLLIGNSQVDQNISIQYGKNNMILSRQDTDTGVPRFSNSANGYDLVILPNKAMLLDTQKGVRIADECQPRV